MNKLVTELALLSQNEQEKIKEGLQNQIEHKAKLKMETAPEDYLQYLEDEIENAKNALDVLADESTRVGAILPTISFNYVWNKERLNTLKRLRQEWESRPDAAVPEPQQDAAAKSDVLILPDELNTQKAQKTFAKAIEKGWMQLKLDGSIVWLGFGNRPSKAQLAYLCAKVYGYQYTANRGNIGGRVPYEALERLFNVKRLDRATQQVFESSKPQLWRKQIDGIITE